MQKKLAIITTHPIQYNAPFFRMLAKEKGLQLKVFYTWGRQSLKKYDPGFNRVIEWDIPLLEGYDFEWMANVAKRPGSHHFRGIDNPGLVRQLTAWNPAAILVYGWAFKSHLQIIRHFHKKKPLWFRGDSTLLDRQPPFKSWLRRQVLRWVYKKIDRALYAGTNNREYFLANGLKEEQLVFMPHAVDNDRYGQRAGMNGEKRRGGKEEHFPPGCGVRFLYAGKLEPKKNLALLIEAFQRLGLPDAQLLIVGNGPLEEELKKKAGGSTNILFLPFQNQAQMPALLASADVVVLPSKKNETWGLILNEAMAAGKAILASTACGAAVDLVKEGVNGFSFRNNDGKDLVEKLGELAQSKDAVREMGARSGESIGAWSYRQCCDAIKKLVEADC